MLRRLTSAIIVVLSCMASAGLSPAKSENAPPSTEAAKTNAEVTVESAPRPAQIEPMVAPVKRTAPQSPAATPKAAKSGDAGKGSVKVSETEASSKKPVTKAAANKAH